MDQFSNHADVERVRTDGRRAGHVDAEFLTGFTSLLIQVEQDFHVIGQEADRSDDERFRPLVVQRPDVIDDIGLQPRIARPTAAALVDEAPAFRRQFHCGGNQTAGLVQLDGIVAIIGHAERNAVRREGDSRDGTAGFGELLECRADPFDVGRDEVGVIVEDSHLVDRRRGRSDEFSCGDDVFTVLTAAGIGTVS